MNKLDFKRFGFLLGAIVLVSIDFSAQDQKLVDVLKVRFVNEYVIPSKMEFEETIVGGLSGIDFFDGKFYAVCDDEEFPRCYVLDISISEIGIQNISIESVIHLRDYEGNDYSTKYLDPEDFRVDASNEDLVWVSEGKVKKGAGPKIIFSNKNGNEKRTVMIDSWKIPSERKKGWGPRHNKTLECLTLSEDGESVWVAMEIPMKQDGKKPKLKKGKFPVRFSQFNKEGGNLVSQHAYLLDSIARPSKTQDGVALNGLTAILAYNETSFLTIERSYSQGHEDGGNDVKIYLSSIKESTDVKDSLSLKVADYVPMIKELIFDFNTIRNELVNGVVDNIEGICFGPILPNGNKSLFVISDDNFNKYGAQKTQVILLEITSD